MDRWTGHRALDDILAKSKSVFKLIFPAIEIGLIPLFFFIVQNFDVIETKK